MIRGEGRAPPPRPSGMTELRVYTFDELAVFDALTTPVWIVDFDRGARCWVNLACLPLWNTTSRPRWLGN